VKSESESGNLLPLDLGGYNLGFFADKMRLLLVSLVLVHSLQVVVGPPVTANKKEESDNKDEEHKGADWVSDNSYRQF